MTNIKACLYTNIYEFWDNERDYNSIGFKEKAKIYKTFEDPVLKHFGKLLIYEEEPDALTKEDLVQVKKEIAQSLTSTNPKPYITFPDAYKKIDDLREKDETDKKFLNEYDQFLQNLESNHKKNL